MVISDKALLFDWDDTWYASSYMSGKKISISKIKDITEIEDREVVELLTFMENNLIKVIEKYANTHDIYIVTNAGKGWVEMCLNRVYKKAKKHITGQIPIYSRDEDDVIQFKDDYIKWKYRSFVRALAGKNYKEIIVVGDSVVDISAGKLLKKDNVSIKTIKLINFSEYSNRTNC